MCAHSLEKYEYLHYVYYPLHASECSMLVTTESEGYARTWVRSRLLFSRNESISN